MNLQETKTPREPIPKETDEVASKIVDAAFAVHTSLGPGLLENVYEVCRLHELTKRGLKAERQVSPPVGYDNLQQIALGFLGPLCLGGNSSLLEENVQKVTSCE